MREERAESRVAVRDMTYSWPESAPLKSALQVDNDVQQVRTGLEGLRVRGKSALCLDHRGELVREIDIRLLQRAGLDGAESALACRPDLHIYGLQAHGVDIADFGRQIVGTWNIGDRYRVDGQLRPILKDRGNESRVVDIHLLNGRGSVTIDRCLEVEARCHLRHGRQVHGEGRTAGNGNRERCRTRR